MSRLELKETTRLLHSCWQLWLSEPHSSDKYCYTRRLDHSVSINWVLLWADERDMTWDLIWQYANRDLEDGNMMRLRLTARLKRVSSRPTIPFLFYCYLRQGGAILPILDVTDAYGHSDPREVDWQSVHNPPNLKQHITFLCDPPSPPQVPFISRVV